MRWLVVLMGGCFCLCVTGATNAIAQSSGINTNLPMRVVAGAVTNICINKSTEVKNQTINVSVSGSDDDKNEEKRIKEDAWWLKWGISESTIGLIVGAFLTALGAFGKFLFDLIRSEVASRRSLKSQKYKDGREDAQRMVAERKRSYKAFVAFYLVVVNKLRADAEGLASQEEEKKEWDQILPPGSIRKAAEINSEMQVCASESVAALHLKFMDVYKLMTDGRFTTLREGIDKLSESLKVICAAMRKELGREAL